MKSITLMAIRAVALALIFTAGLKLLYFFRIPVTNLVPDPVIGFLTNRELLLISSLFELEIAYILFNSLKILLSACAILYFGTCASLYQLALLFEGDHDYCSCLGIATGWLGAGTTTFLSRIILILIWIVGLYLLRHSAKSHCFPPISATFCAVLISTIPVVEGQNVIQTTPIILQGEYLVYRIADANKEKLTKTLSFTATADQDVLLVSYMPPLPPARYNSLPFTNIVLISKTHYASIGLPIEGDQAVAHFASPYLAWQLGNCSDVVISCAFLTIRCLDLFPLSQSSTCRPLASTFTVAGQPFSLISEAKYSVSRSTTGNVLTSKVRVSDRLRKNWRNSLLLDPALRVDKETPDFRQAQDQITRYPSGFLLEEMHFHGFTNVFSFEIPRFSEFRRFFAPRTNAEGLATNGIHYETARLHFNILRQSSVSNVTLPSVTALKKITVSESRLNDRALHISGVTYVTNHLSSLEISRSAQAAFEIAMQRARNKELKAQYKRLLKNTLLVLAFIGPLLALSWKIIRTRKQGAG